MSGCARRQTRLPGGSRLAQRRLRGNHGIEQWRRTGRCWTRTRRPAYQRTIRVGRSAGVIDVRRDKTESLLAVCIDLPTCQFLMKVVERVRRIFDLGADPLRIVDDLSRDARLKPLLDCKPGLR